jgi:hypothetical protein
MSFHTARVIRDWSLPDENYSMSAMLRLRRPARKMQPVVKGPGCVKSRKYNLHLELPSRFRRFENEGASNCRREKTTKKMILRFFCRCDFSNRLGHNRPRAGATNPRQRHRPIAAIDPLPLAPKIGVIFSDSCQWGRAEIPIIAMGSTGAVGGHSTFIDYIFASTHTACADAWEGT